MSKIPVNEEPIRNVEYTLGSGARNVDTYLYPVFIHKRPTTVTIYNVATTDGSWTRVPAVGTTLSGVLSWRLAEKEGGAFDYAFTAAPTTYMTSFGAIIRDTDLVGGAIWARRRDATNIDLQLEVWT